MSIAICALTYKRPERLAQLLAGLRRLRFTERAPEIRVIVVDNDASGRRLFDLRREAERLSVGASHT